VWFESDTIAHQFKDVTTEINSSITFNDDKFSPIKNDVATLYHPSELHAVKLPFKVSLGSSTLENWSQENIKWRELNNEITDLKSLNIK
jgi:hypothetical protein